MSGVRIAHAPDGAVSWYAVYRPTRPDWPLSPPPAERTALRGHRRFLDQLTASGVCVAAGPLLDGSLEVAVLDGLVRREARALCEQDPVVAGGHFTVELVPMRLSHERGSATAAQ